MKTISKLTMLFAFVVFANTLMASGNLKVNIHPLTSEKAVIAISNTTACNFQINIENKNGETIFFKETGTDSQDYRKIFDFSNLESGDYKLIASIDGSSTIRSFKIQDKNISVGKEKSIVAPYFLFKEGVLKLSYLNFSEEDLNLNFYSKSDLVYSKNIGNKFNVIEGFDLSKLDNGTYTVILSTNDKDYAYNVDIK